MTENNIQKNRIKVSYRLSPLRVERLNAMVEVEQKSATQIVEEALDLYFLEFLKKSEAITHAEHREDNRDI